MKLRAAFYIAFLLVTVGVLANAQQAKQTQKAARSSKAAGTKKTAQAKRSAEPEKLALVSGRWILTTKTPQGVQILTLDFVQDGTKLTGVAKPEGGSESDIKGGSVSGNTVTFNVEEQQGGKKVKVEYKGMADGDNMKGTVQRGGSSLEFSAKRSKYEG